MFPSTAAAPAGDTPFDNKKLYTFPGTPSKLLNLSYNFLKFSGLYTLKS